MKKLDWKPLSERRREKRLILMYKIVNDHDLITIPAETHITPNRGITRSSTTNKLKLYSYNSDTYKHSFIPRTIIDWNNLSDRCTRATSLETFKGEHCGLESLPATSTTKAQPPSWALCSVVKYQPSILQIQRQCATGKPDSRSATPTSSPFGSPKSAGIYCILPIFLT